MPLGDHDGILRGKRHLDVDIERVDPSEMLSTWGRSSTVEATGRVLSGK